MGRRVVLWRQRENLQLNTVALLKRHHDNVSSGIGRSSGEARQRLWSPSPAVLPFLSAHEQREVAVRRLQCPSTGMQPFLTIHVQRELVVRLGEYGDLGCNTRSWMAWKLLSYQHHFMPQWDWLQSVWCGAFPMASASPLGAQGLKQQHWLHRVNAAFDYMHA